MHLVYALTRFVLFVVAMACLLFGAFTCIALIGLPFIFIGMFLLDDVIPSIR
jgi:hypothetical protein